MSKIILIEDNEAIREAIKGYLELNDHEVFQFGRLENVLEFIKNKNPDLAIIDVMLPDGSGFNLARQIRKTSNMPFIFLTARDQESDRITGFEIGADDYVVKPFSPRELTLRVEALLKRTDRNIKTEKNRPLNRCWQLENDVLIIDEEKHIIRENNTIIDLTAAEWKIIYYLAQNNEILLPRSKLLSECLDYFYEGSERIIDTHIKNIRAKLKNENWIKTIRGFGYRFSGKQQEENGID
jgi:two-component system phosphate regulon response regulator PhoB